MTKFDTPESVKEDPIIRSTAHNTTLPPQHRIWQNLIDMMGYIMFLIIALFAAIHHIEDKAFWIPYTAITVGVLMRSRGGKIDADTILRIVGR